MFIQGVSCCDKGEGEGFAFPNLVFLVYYRFSDLIAILQALNVFMTFSSLL